jgi:hypothetical protein
MVARAPCETMPLAPDRRLPGSTRAAASARIHGAGAARGLLCVPVLGAWGIRATALMSRESSGKMAA